MKNLAEFEYLWTTQARDHCLVRVGTGDYELVIFNLLDRTALVIEDDSQYRTVLKKMVDSGVPIHESIPPE